jgi:hypothetical protein
MSAISQGYNLSDVSKITLNNGRFAKLFEVIAEMNPIVEDVPFVPSNDGETFKSTELTGYPTTYYRMLNQGVPTSKDNEKMIRNGFAQLTNAYQVDRKLVTGTKEQIDAFMARKDMIFTHALMNELATTMVYGDSATDTDKFTGIEARLSVPSTDFKQAGYNLISGGGTGSDNTSIIGVIWNAEDGAFGFYPEGSQAGLKVTRYRDIEITDSGGTNKFVGHKNYYEQDAGLVVTDWHHIMRACNIDVSDLTFNGATGANLSDLLTRLEIRVSGYAGKPVFYVNKTIYSFLTRQVKEKVGGNLGYSEVKGKRILDWNGIPIKQLTIITNTEATVSGTFTTD